MLKNKNHSKFYLPNVNITRDATANEVSTLTVWHQWLYRLGRETLHLRLRLQYTTQHKTFIHRINHWKKQQIRTDSIWKRERERERPCVRTSRARSRRRMSRGAERRRRSGRRRRRGHGEEKSKTCSGAARCRSASPSSLCPCQWRMTPPRHPSLLNRVCCCLCACCTCFVENTRTALGSQDSRVRVLFTASNFADRRKEIQNSYHFLPLLLNFKRTFLQLCNM